MGTEYTISKVSEKTREYADKVVYYVRLNEAQADVPSQAFELHKKQTSKPPESGHRLDVKTFQKGDFQGVPFVKIIQDYQDRGGGSGGGRSSGGGGDGEGPGLQWQNKPYNSSAEHPRNEARVIHTVALSNAPAYIEQMLTVGVVPQPTNDVEYWTLVNKVTAQLTRTYDYVLSAAGSAESAPKPAQEIPADTNGLEPQSQVTDASIPF